MVDKKENKVPKVESGEVKEEPKKEINFLEMLNHPLAQTLVGSCRDLFKKEKVDPDVCEITIKAPSEVVLKLFNVRD